MKSLLFLLSLLLTVTVFTGCNNEEDEEGPLPSQFLSREWKLLDVGFTDSTGVYLSLFDSLPDCDRDDRVNFTIQNVYTFTEGATKCDVTDPQVYESGNWALANNNTQLLTTPSDTSQSPTIYTVRQLDANRLVLESPDFFGTSRITLEPVIQ